MMFDAVRDLYSAEIRRHARAPEHSGRPAAFGASARGDNPMCGDRVEVFIRRDGDTISQAGFEARGCEISIASADLMCEAVEGRTPEQIRYFAGEVEAMVRTGRCEECHEALDHVRPLSAVHEYPSRVKCVTLPWRALLAAIDGGKEATSE